MKLLVKTAASTAVVLVALAGCASRSSGGGTSAAGSGSGASSSGSSSGVTSTTGGSQSAPGSGGSSSGASGSAPGGQTGSQPDPSAQVKYVSPTDVSLDKDGVTLVTEVAWGGCNDQPQLIVTSQDASKVVVELKETSHQRIGVMCPDIAREGAAKVKLDAPLGSRQVVDGVKNVPITVH